MMINAIDAGANPKHKGAKAQSFQTPFALFRLTSAQRHNRRKKLMMWNASMYLNGVRPRV